jgi:hypothetical protein
MEIHLHVTRRHLVGFAAIAAAALGGVAYAAIPGPGGLLTACQLSSNGSLRLIDPSLPSGPLSRCTSNETQVQWNQQGQPGASGQDGKDGAGPTVTQLAAGDTHCSAGGASIADAAGGVAYVCNGATGQAGRPGRDGAPFSGTFTSPNGHFTLTVADGGVSIVGPDSAVSLPAAGGIVIHGGDIETVADDVETAVAHDETTTVGHDRTQVVGNDTATTIAHNRTESVGNDESVTIAGDRTVTVHKGDSVRVDLTRRVTVGGDELIQVSGGRSDHLGGLLALRASGGASILASSIDLNGMGGCKPAARQTDLVSSTQITTGSTTVCIG